MRFLNFFGRPNIGRKPLPLPGAIGGNGGTGGVPVAGTRGHGSDEPVELAVSKAVGQLEFIARSYAFPLCTGGVDDLKADLFTMLRHHDLKAIRVELIGSDGRVAFEFCVRFAAGGRPVGNLVDTGRGVELPVLDRQLIKDHRLVIERKGLESRYRHLLRLSWTKAENISKSTGGEYRSEHADAISGGRMPATFHVSDAARHRFCITRVGAKGYFFAQDLDTGRDGVFALVKQLPPGFDCRVGARFTGVLIAVPKGFQVRDIRAA